MSALLAELAPGLDPIGFVAIFASVFLGAFVQGSIGFGLNLVIVPVIAIFVPESLPAAAILIAIPMTFGSAIREYSHIDRRAVLWATLGRLPGVVVGAWLVSVLSVETLATVIGWTVVFAVAISTLSRRFEIDRSSLLAAGLLAGLMGTTSSIGGPPMALLYQHEPGPVVRSTIGATFLAGTVVSIAALAWVGEVRAFHFELALAMVPAVLLGLVASRVFHSRLDRGWIRPGILSLCGLMGLGVIAQGVLGR